MAKRMTDAQVFDFLDQYEPGLIFKVKELKVGESIEVEGFTISSEPGGITKIVRPDWVNEMEAETSN